MRAAALAALRDYRQGNGDGSLVLVSREALDEAIETLSNLYALGLMAEEMGETIQLIGKALRFGIDTPRHDGECARTLLPKEVGDVRASIRFAISDGIIGAEATRAAEYAKFDKLIDPDSVDDQGLALAPRPRGYRNE